MKTSARFLAMLLAVLMIAGAALTASAFSDVKAGQDHIEAINVLSQLGVIGGYEDGTFKPDQAVTRAEMAKLAYVLYTTFQDAGKGSVKFSDVADDNWAVGYISWCYNRDIIGGYGDGKFGPSDNVTYDQALKMVCGALGYTEWDSSLWPIDVRTKALKELKLGAGIEGVAGDAKLTRAQVAQIMYNALTANMKETYTEMVDVPSIPGFQMPVTKNKTLAEHVWGFATKTYEVVGTIADSVANDSIKIREVDAQGNYLANPETVKLEKLGLKAYDKKTDILKGLWLITVSKNGEMLASATVKGTITDGIKLEIPNTKTAKTIVINGVEYTADSENIPTIAGIEKVFGEEGKVSADLAALIAKAYMARVFDYNGDGKDDHIVIATKAAYEVTSVPKKATEKITFTELDGDGTIKALAENISVEVAKGDVVVAAQLGDTVYAEIVAPVTASATKLSGNKVTLNELGEVVFGSAVSTIAGIENITLSATEILGVDKIYYIYGNEIIKTDATTTALSDYNFAILKEIKKLDGKLDPTTMTNTVGYTAVLVVDGVEKEVALAKDVAIKSNGTNISAENAFTTYQVTFPSTVAEYKYTLVAAYEETDKGYVLTINTDLDGEPAEGETDIYKVLPAGTKISYNATTGLYTVGDINKVMLDDTSAIFYRYDKPLTSTGSFMFLDKYTKDSITTKSFVDAETYGETYLAYNATTKMWTLLATIMKDEIEVITEESTVSFVTDGRLIVYATEDSAEVLDTADKKNYLEYVFMNNETLEPNAPVVDKTLESKDATKTVAGGLYGWNGDKYVAITAKNVAALELKTVKAAKLSEVLAANSVIGFKVGETESLIKVADTVSIWGVSDEEDASVVTALTVAELGEMLDLLNAYNANNSGEDDSIDILLTYYKDSNDDYILSSIIVEIFEADEDDAVYSVNDIIFDIYNA